ncbi:GNAT family N-acetyltransferase [Rhizobium sp. Root1220]|uniref:GNAT family N-acetyltransferase n=1 Tax=Rhizobium sp. Root1220 TaxID=1736432 RepID=UPI0006F3FE49|nr:GNAT family N-acetyltransferase [Rhizobium sp. Root1220]KQV81472.1 acetyltransferase [Rhizobium sp. Root1220]
MLISLRRIDRADVVRGGHIIVKAYAEPPWEENWTIENATSRLDELATTPGYLAVAAYDADDLVGFAFAVPHTSAIGRGLQLAEIAILPQHQRTGIGTRLLRHIEHEALSLGYAQIWLVSQRAGAVADYYTANEYSPSCKLCVYSKRLGDHAL